MVFSSMLLILVLDFRSHSYILTCKDILHSLSILRSPSAEIALVSAVAAFCPNERAVSSKFFLAKLSSCNL